MVIAEREFIINSSPDRIGQLMMKAMIEALQPEMMEASDEKFFRCRVRAKIGPLSLPVYITGEITTPVNPVEMMTRISGLGRLIGLNQRTLFEFRSIEKTKTAITSRIVMEDMTTLVRVCLLWRIKRFATDILERFEMCLRSWA